MFKIIFEKIKKDNRGATIIIAIGIAILTIMVATTLGYQIQANKNSIVRFKDKNQAKVYAEDILSGLIAEMGKHEAGFNLDEGACSTKATAMLNPTGQILPPGLAVQCSVMGRAIKVSGTGSYIQPNVYIAPAPGTGNAGDNCTPLKPSTSGTPEINLNDSCNWGKLAFGNSFTSRVLVPLYYDIGAQTSGCGEERPDGPTGPTYYICNPSKTGDAMTKLIVRVRAPLCKPEDMSVSGRCANGRYILAPGTGTAYIRDEDPTLVNWDISGNCTVGSNTQYCSLIPVIMTGSDNKRTGTPNSEIYGSLINTTGNNIVLAQDKQGTDVRLPNLSGYNIPYIIDFLTDNGIWNNSAYIDQALSKPVLNLSLIAKELATDSTPSRKLSNLEYQILSDKPISNNSDIYYVFVTYNGQGFKIVKSVDQEKNLVDYAVQN